MSSTNKKIAIIGAVCAGKGGAVTAGHKGLLALHSGKQIGLAAVVQFAEHIVQQHDRVFARYLLGAGGFGQLQAQHSAALLALAAVQLDGRTVAVRART